MNTRITASTQVCDTEVHVEATHETCPYGSEFTWIRVLNADDGSVMAEDWTTGHVNAAQVLRTARRLVSMGKDESCTAHLVGMNPHLEANITVIGRTFHVRGTRRLDDDSSTHTWLRVTDTSTGDVVMDEEVPGWLDEGHLRWVIGGRLRQPLATADYAWTQVTLQDGVVVSDFCEPTESGLAEVIYQPGGRGIVSITVTANLSEWQNEAVADLLLDYLKQGRRAGGNLAGIDRVCLHDPAFRPAHDRNCALVAFDQMAGALQVEVQALLAEPQPGERGENTESPHT